jgi:hypothetical protein
VAGKRVLILPNERSKIVFANRLEEFHATDHHFVLMHQTFKGSIVANGMEMDGIDPNMGAVSDTIWISGDIHVPQQIGDVLYCGAPHPINFGDSYTPRILLWDRKGVRSLIRSATKKHVIETATISDPKIGDIAPGDFAKVILKLTPADSTEWETQRSLLEQMAARGGWTLAGFEVRIEDPSGPLKGRASKELKSPADVLKDFCAKNSIPTEMLTLGEKLLNDTV